MKEYRAEILENKRIAQDIYRMVLRDESFERALPGQFAHLRIPDGRHILRRPISVHAYDSDKREMSLIYQVRGEGTRILSAMKPGECVDTLMPLGRGFSVPDGAKEVWLLGGGIGAAPLFEAYRTWGDKVKAVFLGFRSLDVAYGVDLYDKAAFYVATEDGSFGAQGYITDMLDRLLEKKRPDLILSCGPVPMLRAFKRVMEKYPDVACQVSLEERMGCGIGGCLVCSCKIPSGDEWSYKRVCKDGPVFDLKEVPFDD